MDISKAKAAFTSAGQTDPTISALFASLRLFLVMLGAAMAGAGLAATPAYHFIMVYGGIAVAVGPSAWGVYASYVNVRRARAVGVVSGMRIVADREALAPDGSVVTHISAETTPFKDVTLATSDQIVEKYGPIPSSIAKK